MMAAEQAAEMRRLQAEVDQLKQRLDFISPMLPLVSVVQDYFDKVESEASAQMVRLKKAQVVPQWPWDERASKGKAQLETTKLFHVLAEAVIGGTAMAPPARMNCGSDTDASNIINMPTARKADGIAPHTYGGPPLGTAKLPSTTPHSQSPGVLLFSQSDMSGKDKAPPTPLKEEKLQLPTTDHRFYGYPGQADDCHNNISSPRSEVARRLNSMRGELQNQSGPLTPRRQQMKEQCGVDDDRDRARDRDSAGPMIMEPMTEPSPSDGGVVLGKGSWAAACRMAHGRRAEAFQLLCSTGIVTARELSDDLTVISKEHIEECVLIAMDMLQTRPLDKWSHYPEEAKSFFQTRLAVLYEWR
jgi:hypothetical protein